MGEKSMDYSFAEVVDLQAVQGLMDTLSKAIGLPLAVLDLDDRVLVASGWQDICVRYHRQHPETLLRCRESDGFIKKKLQDEDVCEGEYIAYECRNGLVDIAVPIFIGKQHLATLFQGQFLYEAPDESSFRKQARQFGFPEEPYLEALRRVPVLSQERFREILTFHMQFLNHLVRMGEERLQRLEAQQALMEQKWRLQRQNEELLRLGKLRGITSGDIGSVARKIVETTAQVLEVGRVGFWLYDDERKRIQCIDHYEQAGNQHTSGDELAIASYPIYFTAIETELNIAAHDVCSDPRTQELLPGYLEPTGISSMLDTPVLVGGHLVGILCCEHIGPARTWTYDEQNFAGSMADFLSLALEGQNRRQAEAALQESEEKYRLLFSSEADAILILDAETRQILEANPAATLLYGYSKEEFLHLSVDDITAEPEQALACLNLVLTGQLAKIPLSHHRRCDESVFPVEISSGIFVWKGRKRIAAIIRDVTERQENIRMQEEVLSMVSHEMRTPLTAMLGFTEFLLDNPISEMQQREYLQIIYREGERLQELTENLLDLQRLRAGCDTEDFQAVEIRSLLDAAALLFSKPSATHQIVFVCPPNLPPVNGNEKQLYRALQNLLSNAIKYSPAGGEVTLGARRDGDFAILWVRDQGMGIPEAAHELIFDRFCRGDSVAVKMISGTGLGLALVRAVAENHRGRVWVESTPGEGSTFYLSLPLFQALPG
jgi:hypothetical protein